LLGLQGARKAESLGAELPERLAVEGYPGLLAREILLNRSYKSDNKAKQTPERLIARKDLITALEHGQTRLKLRLKLTHAQRDVLVDDASGDSLDAVLCMIQAAWAQTQRAGGDLRYGLPEHMDPLEGWIITV
jgi:protein-tyrosine-phosphatase